jgi:hypothetical protein
VFAQGGQDQQVLFTTRRFLRSDDVVEARDRKSEISERNVHLASGEIVIPVGPVGQKGDVEWPSSGHQRHGDHRLQKLGCQSGGDSDTGCWSTRHSQSRLEFVESPNQSDEVGPIGGRSDVDIAGGCDWCLVQLDGEATDDHECDVVSKQGFEHPLGVDIGRRQSSSSDGSQPGLTDSVPRCLLEIGSEAGRERLEVLRYARVMRIQWLEPEPEVKTRCPHQPKQHRQGWLSTTGFVGGDHLLADPGRLGQFFLGQTCLLASGTDDPGCQSGGRIDLRHRANLTVNTLFTDKSK